MKIRRNFVANSSSSSYVLMCDNGVNESNLWDYLLIVRDSNDPTEMRDLEFLKETIFNSKVKIDAERFLQRMHWNDNLDRLFSPLITKKLLHKRDEDFLYVEDTMLYKLSKEDDVDYMERFGDQLWVEDFFKKIDKVVDGDDDKVLEIAGIVDGFLKDYMFLLFKQHMGNLERSIISKKVSECESEDFNSHIKPLVDIFYKISMESTKRLVPLFETLYPDYKNWVDVTYEDYGTGVESRVSTGYWANPETVIRISNR